MKITTKLLGELRRYVPAGGGFNEAELEIAEAATPAAVRAQLGLPEGPQLVLVNDERLTPEELDSRTLAEGDVVTFCPPIKGG